MNLRFWINAFSLTAVFLHNKLTAVTGVLLHYSNKRHTFLPISTIYYRTWKDQDDTSINQSGCKLKNILNGACTY